MFRRDFFQRLAATVAGGSSMAAVAAEPAGGTRKNYKVSGFTCPTCALGLEVQLRNLKGILRVRASYEERSLLVIFDEDTVTEEAIRKAVERFGFKLAES